MVLGCLRIPVIFGMGTSDGQIASAMMKHLVTTVEYLICIAVSGVAGSSFLYSCID